jgi:solute carrier family 25 folate transporter 32
MSNKGTDLDAQHPPKSPPLNHRNQPKYEGPKTLSPRHVPIPLPLDPPASNLALYCTRLPNSSINSFCGALGGMASGIVTCPLDVIKTRLQAQGAFNQANKNRSGPRLYHGMIGTARTIWKQDGVRGMYRGLGPMLLGYLPTWAVYMAVYDGSKEYYSGKVGMYLAFLLVYLN